MNSCINVQNQICNDIKFFNSHKCHDNSNITTLDKLCDGNTDCLDKSDEENCTLTG